MMKCLSLCFRLVLIFLLLSGSILSGPMPFLEFLKGEKSKYDWGYVPDEILARMYCPADSSAKAMILFDIGQMEISRSNFEATISRYVRIHIFKEEEKEYANVRIPFWHDDRVFSIAAQVILPNGEKKKLSCRDIREEGEKDDWMYKVFTIPQVQKNCVIEYRYKKTTEYLALLEPWVFQNEIYTKLSRLSVKIPQGFKYMTYLDNAPDPEYTPARGGWESIPVPRGNMRGTPGPCGIWNLLRKNLT